MYSSSSPMSRKTVLAPSSRSNCKVSKKRVHLGGWDLGQFFMEPSDYYDAPIYKVLHFIRGVGLIMG
jgi:hypothetical protein